MRIRWFLDLKRRADRAWDCYVVVTPVGIPKACLGHFTIERACDPSGKFDDTFEARLRAQIDAIEEHFSAGQLRVPF